MAIFHLTHSFLKRSRTSSLAHAAYNSAQKLEDSAGRSLHSDYSRKTGVLHSEIMLPAGSPQWADYRGELWRRLEARENRSTRPDEAVLAHNFNIALPHELALEQNIHLARDFVREQFARKGYAADWAIHAPDPGSDRRNIHLHILVPLRKIEGDSFGKKDRYPKSVLRQQVRAWREAWAILANRHLKRHGHAATIDGRSLKAQGIKRAPTRHRGPLSRKAKQVMPNGLRTLQPTRPLASINRPSRQPAAELGRGSRSVTLRETILRAAREDARRGDAGSSGFRPNISTKGWPSAAVGDWNLWGHKNPPKFFALWPELSIGNAGPGGGL